MECNEEPPSSHRVIPRNVYSQPSANPEDINRIWKVNDKLYYHIVKLNSLGSMDYKELQGVATYLGLPGNLKRKQLMALIVARKKGKENVVDAILNEVNRERAGKKVKHMQQMSFKPMVSAGHVRRLDYNNATLLRNISPPAFKRAKTTQTLKKSKASMQGARNRQLNAAPSTSNLATPQLLQGQFPMPPMGTSEPMPSTSRHMLEHNIPISSAVNPYQPYITDTVTTTASIPNHFDTFNNPAPGYPPAEYSRPNMCVEPTFQIQTINYDYTNMPTSIYLGANSTCTVTYQNRNMSELQGVRSIFMYCKTVMTNVEQHAQHRYLQAQFGEQPLQYRETQVQFDVLHGEQPTHSIEQNMENTEHSESCEPGNETSTQIATPFDTLCNVATSIIENTEENNSTVASGMNNETKTHAPTSDLVTLSNTVLFSLEHKTDIALDFDNILDYILGEGNQMNTSFAAGTANSSISTTLPRQVEPIDYSIKGRGYYHPSLICDKSIMHFAWYNNNAIVSYPLQYTTLGYQSTCFVYNAICTMPGAGTEICFSRPLQGIAHTYETYTAYTPKACVYMDTNNTNTSHQRTPNNTIPDCCLLQPEYSLSYDIPELYLRSFCIRSEYLETNYSSNQLIPNIGNNEAEKTNYHSSQVYYNIMLPNENNNYVLPKLATSNASYVELKPRIKNKPGSMQKKSNNMDFEASIQPLSSDEEMLIYNSLDDIENIDLSISETYHQIMASQHNTQCMNNQIICPFFYTECNWLETVPLMAFHIRRMHREKIVHKNKAEYVINFLQLVALGDRGVKIVHDYNNRMFFVSLCFKKLTVYATLQEVCESVDQHAEKLKGKLIIKLQNGIKYWSGEAHSMYYPLAKLLTPESSLEMPLSFFNSQLSKHFRLYVEIEI